MNCWEWTTDSKDENSRHDILVVDDIPESLEFLADMLKGLGYVVRSVPSGEMALLTARMNPPDLVLLDINMPEMNGFEACRSFKKDENLKDIPIIFLTSLTETREKLEGFNAGGVDYITKPCEPLEVEARIKTHLTVREQERQLRQTAEAEYHSIFNNAVEGIFQAARDGRIAIANPAFMSMLGCTSLEDISLPRDYFVDPQRFDEMVSMLGRDGSVTKFETEVRRKTGDKIWISLSVRAISRNSDLAAYEGMVEDITREKESERKLRALVEAINDTILIIDRDGLFSQVNEYKQGFAGKALVEAYDKETSIFFVENARRSLEVNRTINVEYSIETEDGESWFAASISPMTRSLVLWVARDITELKRAQSALEAKTVKLENINITLNTLLEKMKESNRNLEETMYSNIRTFVMPHVESMKKLKLGDMHRAYLDLIESHLTKLSSPLIHSMQQFNLTPMEIQVANLIRDGRRTKDICNVMHISKAAVDFHRYKIRKKLGINRKKTHLQSFLSSIERSDP